MSEDTPETIDNEQLVRLLGFACPSWLELGDNDPNDDSSIMAQGAHEVDLATANFERS